jgi:uncharacterized lipoprotein NlpE involved in copper resistance
VVDAMKKIALILSILFILCVSGCSNQSVTNLTWENSGNKVGDNDGPSYVVYSKKGYNKASVDVAVSKIKTNLVRKSDKKSLNAYAFLGIDVYSKNDQWQNCADAGLVCTGNNGKWHAFANRYMAAPEDNTWWESSINLDAGHDYQIILDSSQNKEQFILTIIDVTDGNKQIESKTFDLYYAKADGSNTAYYQNYAMDFPEDVRKDINQDDTVDWEKITQYNTNEDLYTKNIRISNAKLSNASGSVLWTEDLTQERFMWPDKNNKITYPCTTVDAEKRDYESIINLNMNH